MLEPCLSNTNIFQVSLFNSRGLGRVMDSHFLFIPSRKSGEAVLSIWGVGVHFGACLLLSRELNSGMIHFFLKAG